MPHDSLFRGPRPFKPVFDILERRLAPAVAFQVLDADNDGFTDLTVTGGKENTQLILTEDRAGNELLFSLNKNGDGDFTDPGEFQDRALGATDGFNVQNGSIFLNLGAGNDSVEYRIVGGNMSGQSRSVLAALGSGANFFDFLSNNNRIVNNTNFEIQVHGGSGRDDVEFEFVGNDPANANIDDSLVAIAVFAGGGNDFVVLDFVNKDAGNIIRTTLDNGASVTVNVDLGTGVNDLLLDLADVGATAQSRFTVQVTGGNAATNLDDVDMDFRGDVANGSVVDIQVNLQAGNDTFSGELNQGTFDVRGAASVFRMNVDGGVGNDLLQVRDNFADPDNESMTVEGLLEIDLHGGAGKDRFFLRFEPDSLFDLASTAILRVRIAGGDGNDIVGDAFDPANIVPLTLSNSAASTGNYDVVIQGNGGNDKVHFLLNDPSGGGVKFGPAQSILLDGGLGADRLIPPLPIANVRARFFEQFGP